MEIKPEFSVIITAYNKGSYLAATLESVLSQTFADFEIILIDDGSSDNTKEIVSKFGDTRLKYFYQENSGLPAVSRNKGMSLSAGRYIAFLDGDDFWYKDKLKRCKEALDRMPEADLVCHNEAVLYQDRVLRRTAYGPYVNDMYSRLLFIGNCLHASAVTMRREIFFDHGIKFSEDKNLYAIEDYEYWLRLSRRYRFHFLPDILGCYRITDKSSYLDSAESNTLHLLKLLDEHFGKLNYRDGLMRRLMKRRRSAVMCAAGRMCQHKNDFQKSKKWYTNAIKEYPLNYKAILGYVIAMLKVRIIYR